jgi:hypothetical protein
MDWKQRCLAYLVAGSLLAPAAVWADEAVEATPVATPPAKAVKHKAVKVKTADDPSDQTEAADPQDSLTAPATKADLEGVHEEVQQLRQEDTWQLATKTALSSRALSIGAIIQSRYTHQEAYLSTGRWVGSNWGGATTNPALGNGDTFSVPLLVLSLQGSLLKDYQNGNNVNYLFSLQSVNGGAPTALDALISYNITPSNDNTKPQLVVSAGQFKKPFGLEPTTTEAYKPTINLAQFDQINGVGKRDAGLQLAGDLFPTIDFGNNYRVPLINYYVALVNGVGPDALDADNWKDVVGRVVLNAPADYNSFFRGFSIGGSAYQGWNDTQFTKTKPTTIVGAAGVAQKQWFGLDAAYVRTPIGFTFEYFQGQNPNAAFDLKGDVSYTNVDSYLFDLFYNFGDKFVADYLNQNRYDDWYPKTYQPFFQFDRYNYNTTGTNSGTDVYTLGFNWFFGPTTKLQLNYNLVVTDGNTLANGLSQEQAQFQYGF